MAGSEILGAASHALDSFQEMVRPKRKASTKAKKDIQHTASTPDSELTSESNIPSVDVPRKRPKKSIRKKPAKGKSGAEEQASDAIKNDVSEANGIQVADVTAKDFASPSKTEEEKGGTDEAIKEEDQKAKPKRIRKKPEPQYDDDGNLITPVKKARAPRPPKPEPVYDIPEIPADQLKSTTWQGNLGYACLNTVLRSKKPDSIFCSRTCRLLTIQEKGIDFAKELGRLNTIDLVKMIEVFEP